MNRLLDLNFEEIPSNFSGVMALCHFKLVSKICGKLFKLTA